MTLQLNSPAKLNLFLRIIKRRPDGYHELASLFQTVNLCDILTYELSDLTRDRMTCTNPSLPTNNQNLVLKAASLFRQKTGLKCYVDVHLEKRIPHEAGLGGGSSNAATTLWALNEITGRPASLEQLIAWAGEIGSDVPFFLSSGTAYCTGRGEIVRSVGALPRQEVLIVKPEGGTSTPAVYGRLDLRKLPHRDPELTLKRFMEGQPEYYNDLEEAASEVLPAIKQIKHVLQDSGYKTVMVSGSGSSLFCMGSGVPPQFEGSHHFQVSFINRPSSFWY